jgi:two-component system chemotaxis response regulator CheB
VSIVQDPLEAIAPSMPQAALSQTIVDYVLRVGEMPGVIERLLAEQIPEPEPVMNNDLPRDIAEIGGDGIHSADAARPPSPFTCPECGGVLWERRDTDVLAFQCHVGHRYGVDSLEHAQSEAVDLALWSALRVLEENIELRRRMARHARTRGMEAVAGSYDQQAHESEQQANVIRRVLMPDAPADFVHPHGAPRTPE